MATFTFIHGAGGHGSDWQLVADELHRLGHRTVLVDLPCDQPVCLDAYVDAVVSAIADDHHARAGDGDCDGDGTDDVVLVAHSLGGLTAPVVASRVPVAAIVFVTAMIPLPGERGGDWWGNTGQAAAFEAQHLPDDSDETIYLNGVPPEVLAASEPPRDQTGEVMGDPNPLESWPDVPTAFLVCADDRFFPAEWMADVVRRRLGIEPEVIPGGHCPYLATPISTAAAIDRAWTARADAQPVTWASSPG